MADHEPRPLRLPAKLALTAEIVTSYIRVRSLMRRGDLSGAVAAARSASPRHGPPAGLLAARRLGGIVDARLRLLPGDTRCLARSLVLLKLLARRGLAGTLVIGVRTEPAFGAHAWVELDGVPLLQPIERGGRRLTEL